MIPTFWRLETEFQRSFCTLMIQQGWHVQPLSEDPKYPGIPDVNAAHPSPIELWAELKLAQRIHHVDETLHLDRRVIPQQASWLLRRVVHSGYNTRCCVVVCYRVGVSDDYITYVSAVPVTVWDQFLGQDLRTAVLQPYTAAWAWLQDGPTTVEQMVRGALVPGHGTGPSSKRPTYRRLPPY